MNSIHLICLGVKDLAASLVFYRDGLGFETTAKENAAIVFFNNGGTKLQLYPLENLQKEIGETAATVSEGFAGFTLAHNTHSKEEVDALLTRAEQAGAVIVKKAVIQQWGGYSGYFKDPDGFMWEVAYGEDWTFDDQGMLVVH